MMSNTKSKRSSIIAYLIPFVILLYTFSLIWGWFPISHTIYILFLGVVVCFIECNSFFNSKPFIPLVLFELVLGLNMLMKDPLHASTNGFLYEMISICITAMMGFYLMRTKDDRLTKITIVMIMIILFINAIGSTFVETILPGSIRACVTEFHTTGSQELAKSFYKYGMASYGMTHAIPTIIPMLVFGIKTIQKSRLKLFFVSVLVASLILCYLGGSTTALILGVLGLLFSLFTKSNRGNSQFVILALFSIVFLLIVSNDAIMLSFLKWSDNMVGNEGPFHAKIIDFEKSIMYDETGEGVGGRKTLYLMSLDAIVSNPVFGTNSKIIGHHSTLLDHCACLGLIGVIPFILFIYRQIKNSGQLLSKNSRMFYIQGSIIAVLMLAVKSMDGWESWLFLFVVLPLMARYIESISFVNSNNTKR